MMISRRRFINTTATVVAGSTIPANAFSFNFSEKKFTLCLNAGNIGVKASQQQVLDMAIKYGYEAISVNVKELAEMSDSELADYKGKMKANNISWGSAGLPVDFRKDEKTFNEGITPLPEYASALNKAGANRMNTWILSFDHNLTYRQNFEQHKQRLRQVATILKDHGVRLGLEYVGPRTLQASGKFSFVRTMAETKELISAIDRSNVGFVLDSFHWYCAGETKDDLLTLSNEEIIAVDLNDARSGFTADQQIDGKRELPSATGVIDLKTFMSAMVTLGYDGPMRAEPFNQPLRDMEDGDALQATYDAMKSTFDLV